MFASLSGLVLQGWHVSEVQKSRDVARLAQQDFFFRLYTAGAISDKVAILRELVGATLLSCEEVVVMLVEGEELLVRGLNPATPRHHAPVAPPFL